MPVELDAIINNILDIHTIDVTRYVAPYYQTKWIVCSSLFFLVPCAYGYMSEQYFLSIISFLTSACSINFWRDANYSYRRTIDVIMAKIAFLVYVGYGVINVTSLPYVIAGYTGLFGVIYCYYMSNKHGDSELWWKFHMLFHFLISWVQIIAIKCINDNTMFLKDVSQQLICEN